jgi:hypothetical protein
MCRWAAVKCAVGVACLLMIGVVDGLEAEERLCGLMNALCLPPPPLPAEAAAPDATVSGAAESASTAAAGQHWRSPPPQSFNRVLSLHSPSPRGRHTATSPDVIIEPPPPMTYAKALVARHPVSGRAIGVGVRSSGGGGGGASLLTEIHLCDVCSCPEMLRRSGRGQVGRVRGGRCRQRRSSARMSRRSRGAGPPRRSRRWPRPSRSRDTQPRR